MPTSHSSDDISVGPDVAPYLQIADHFRRQIALGALRPGDRMPAIRELARKMGLDPGTVARAYQELKREGIVVSRSGGGSFVSSGASEKHLAEQQQRRLGTLLDRAILEALGLGFATEDVEAAFLLRLMEWRERRRQASAHARVAVAPRQNDIRFSGSHDIAVELLSSHLSALYHDVRLIPSFVGSLGGLMALQSGEADVAGAHLLDSDTGEFNIPFVKRLMPHDRVALINLVQRVQGLIVAPGNPKHITGIADLKRPDVTFVNRQKGSGTRMLLDSRLLAMGIAPEEIKGYEHEENTHVAVATVVEQAQADVGLGTESAANVTGLEFIPLFKERYDLIALQQSLDRPAVQRMVEVLSSDGYRRMLQSLPGYDLSQTGSMVKAAPAPVVRGEQ